MDFSLHSLEYDRLKELLGRYMSTDAARQLLADLQPSTDASALEEEHAITAEAMTYLREFRVAFTDIELLQEALHKLTISGASLEIAEIEAVQSFLSQIEGLRVRWKDAREQFPRLAASAHRLPDLR